MKKKETNKQKGRKGIRQRNEEDEKGRKIKHEMTMTKKQNKKT